MRTSPYFEAGSLRTETFSMYRSLAFPFVVLLAVCGAVGAVVWHFTPPAQTIPGSPSKPDAQATKPNLGVLGAQTNPEVKLPANIQIRFREATKDAGIAFR